MCKFSMIVLLYTRADENVFTTKLEDVLKENGGKVTLKENWEERKLAYKIKGQETAIYMLFDFSLKSSRIKNVEDYVNNNKNIIKYVINKKC